MSSSRLIVRARLAAEVDGLEEEDLMKEFQDRLVTLLASEEDPEAVVLKLLSDQRFESLRDYLAGMDTDMVAVAMELVQKWGRAKDEPEI